MKEFIEDEQLAEVLAYFRSHKKTVTTAESCTGGLLAGRITDIAGSSDVFHRGFVTYCDQAKHQMLGVRKKTLKQYTAVSRQTAKEMAKGGAKAAKADCCLSVTGYAGPPCGPEDTTVGLVYIGCYYEGKTKVCKYQFSGSRSNVRRQAVEAALSLLISCLKK